MKTQLSQMVNYANIDLTTKERFNVLPKQHNFVEILMKPCVSRMKPYTNKYLYSLTKIDLMQLWLSFLYDSLVSFNGLVKVCCFVGK